MARDLADGVDGVALRTRDLALGLDGAVGIVYAAVPQNGRAGGLGERERDKERERGAGHFRLLWVWFDGVFWLIVLDGLFGWIAGRVGMRWLGTVLGIRQPENVIHRVAHGFNGWGRWFSGWLYFQAAYWAG